jgi:CheY-like chemotaxis protein
MNLAATFELLLVEDDEDDRDLLMNAFVSVATKVHLNTVTDGIEAQAYLAGEGKFGDRECHPLPSLILLDLKLPRKSGLEVLEWIRAQASLREIPVVILTSSEESRDINRAYALGANSFLVKNGSSKEMVRIALGIQTYAELLGPNRDP